MNPDAAIDLPRYRRLMLICCLVVFGCYFGTYMRLPIVPLYARSLGAGTTEVGLINAAFLFMAGSLSLPLGLLSDRLSMKILALVGVALLAGTSFLLSLSSTPAQLVWIYLLSGVGLAAFGPTIMGFVANFSPPTHLGRSYGWYTTALYTGMSLGPAAGGFVAQGLGFPSVFNLAGAAIFVTFWVLFFFLPRARQVLGARPPAPRLGLDMLRELARNRHLLGCWLATLGSCFGLGMFLTYLPLHAHDQGLSYGQIGLVFAFQGLLNVLCRIPFGHLSDRVAKRSNLVVIGLIGLAAPLGGYGLAHTTGQFLICTGVLGASMGLTFTSIGALTAETAAPALRGLAMGGYNASIYLGMMLSSACMGPVIHRFGFAGGFYLTTVINLLVAAGFYLLMQDFPRRGGVEEI
jgi:MFS transporter, DHA1 family, multidrug resistance protein